MANLAAMPSKPKLLKISNREYRCPLGDWSVQRIKPRNVSTEEWDKLHQSEFDDHVRRCHPRANGGRKPATVRKK